MTKIKYNTKCWRKIEDSKGTIKFQCASNGNETAVIFKLGNSWVATGGREKPENVTFAPTFYKSKKRAIQYLESATSRIPHTYINKNGDAITEYSD
jgi:hypothetical protein